MVFQKKNSVSDQKSTVQQFITNGDFFYVDWDPFRPKPGNLSNA